MVKRLYEGGVHRDGARWGSGTREGCSFQHVEAITVAIDQAQRKQGATATTSSTYLTE